MGRAVRLHPLAIALSLTAGTALWGIAGGVVAVPFAAVLNRVSSYLSNEEPPLGTPSPYHGLHAPQKQKRRRLAALWRAVRGRPARRHRRRHRRGRAAHRHRRGIACGRAGSAGIACGRTRSPDTPAGRAGLTRSFPTSAASSLPCASTSAAITRDSS